MDITPATLIGESVRLEPLSEAHIPGLWQAGQDESIWEFMRYGKVTTIEKMRVWVLDILSMQASGSDLPFTVFHKPTGAIVGATRFLEIDQANRSLEVGGTWYQPAVQRTTVNTECKYLLLTHAFEKLGCVRVQLKTDLRNLRSQKAIERIGAIREGVLRNHMILPDGYIRSSVIYSILDSEWAAVKEGLEKILKR